MKVKALFKIMFLAATLISCKKDRDGTSSCALNLNELSGTYQLTGLRYKSSSSAQEENYMFLISDCERDDRIRLNSNGTYQYLDIGTTCVPAGNDEGNWNVTGNQLQSDGLFTGTIAGYDCRVLTYFVEDIYTAGDKLTFIMTKQ